MNFNKSKYQTKINYEQYQGLISDVDKLNNMQFDPAVFTVLEDNSGIFVSSIAQAEVEEIPEEFTITEITGDSVTIAGGVYTIGETDFTIADKTFTITNNCILGIEYTFSEQSIDLINFGSTYAQDTDHIRKRLYEITYASNTASIETKCNHVIHPANWSNYGV